MSTSRKIVISLLRGKTFFVDHYRGAEGLAAWFNNHPNDAKLFQSYVSQFSRLTAEMPAETRDLLQDLLNTILTVNIDNDTPSFETSFTSIEALEESLKVEFDLTQEENFRVKFHKENQTLLDEQFEIQKQMEALQNQKRARGLNEQEKVELDGLEKPNKEFEAKLDTVAKLFESINTQSFFITFAAFHLLLTDEVIFCRFLSDNLSYLSRIFTTWEKERETYIGYFGDLFEWQSLKIKLSPSKNISYTYDELVEISLSRILHTATNFHLKIFYAHDLSLDEKKECLKEFRLTAEVDFENLNRFLLLTVELESCSTVVYSKNIKKFLEDIKRLRSMLDKLQEEMFAEINGQAFVAALQKTIETKDWEVFIQTNSHFISLNVQVANETRVVTKRVPSSVAAQYMFIEKANRHEIFYSQARKEIEQLGMDAHNQWFSTRFPSTRAYYGLFAPGNSSALHVNIDFVEAVKPDFSKKRSG